MASPVVAAGTKRTTAEPSSTSSSSEINHEVFLNFRGKDTRKEFTDVLYKQLKSAGIEVFKDDKMLRAGDKISQGLKDAIKRSKISIAIFSKNYASSEYCLMELVQMWECRESDGQIIIPIFYDVRPYAVKKPEVYFATSFEKHEADKKVDSNTIKKWKEVLQQVGELSGFDRELINGGHVVNLLEEVVTFVWRELKKDDQLVTDKLVGIDRHVREMMTKLGVVYSQGQAIAVCGQDVRVVGICGMRGVGKTTLAKVVFNKIHKLFNGCSFLEDINSEEVKVSQEILIADLQKEKRESLRSSGDGIKKISSRFTNMKVLIVIDNVHKDEQIEALAGKPNWFGSGSRIIVTIGTENVLKGFDFGEDNKDRAAKEHKVEPLKYQHAWLLFKKHVFPGDAKPDVPDYDSLSKDTVKAIGGLPMAIWFQAKYLKENMTIESWRSNLNYLKDHSPDKDVEAVFEVSYNSLNDTTKKIFLDIACFFIGKDERIPPYMWRAWGCDPLREIKCLRDMHFLEDGENNELRMQSLLRDFGRKLVKRKVLQQRCRIWNLDDASSILGDGQCNERVQGISLTVEKAGPVPLTCVELDKKLNLRYLRLDGATLKGQSKNLLPNLRWLDWQNCHFIPELRNMDLKELVILDLSRSPVTTYPRDWRQIIEKVEELKVLNLQGCDLLRASLKFSASIKLEILIMEDCTRSPELGTFISKLKSLKSLNLRNCKGVQQLVQRLQGKEFLTELLIDGTDIKEIHIQNDSLMNLEKLSACNCERLEDISTIGRLRNLTSLALNNSVFNELSETFEFPPNLRRLYLRSCSVFNKFSPSMGKQGRLVRSLFNKLPPSIGKLGRLEVMDLSFTGITELPESVKDLRNLKTLKMEGTHLKKFPEDIVKLEKLEEIDFSGCRSLEGQVPCDISVLSSLRILRLTSSMVAGLPKCICCLSRLQTLDLRKCKQLQALPELPPSLLTLCWGSKIMAAPKLTNMTDLKELRLNHDEQPEAGSSNQTPHIGWIMGLTSLETLELSLPNVTNLPADFSALIELREITLSYMKELVLTQLPSSSSLWTLRLKSCKIQSQNFLVWNICQN